MDAQSLQVIEVVVLAAIVMIGIVAVLAPAALAVIIKPLVEVLERLIDAIVTKPKDPPAP